jgi:hypothetical protein
MANIKFKITHLRNGVICNSKSQAMRRLKQQLYKMDESYDGTIILSRYRDYRDNVIKTITGVVYCNKDGDKSITTFNTDKTISITPTNKLEDSVESENLHVNHNATN